MSIFDKLKFWGKKEESGLGVPELGKAPELGQGLDVPKLPEFGKSPMDIPPEDFGKPVSSTQYGKSPFPEHEMESLKETAPNVPRGMQQQQPQWQGYKESSEMQVISAKLDALKASLDSINQRIANLERIAQGEQPQRRWQYK